MDDKITEFLIDAGLVFGVYLIAVTALIWAYGQAGHLWLLRPWRDQQQRRWPPRRLAGRVRRTGHRHPVNPDACYIDSCTSEWNIP